MLKTTGRTNRTKMRKIDEGGEEGMPGRGAQNSQNQKMGGGEKSAALNQYSTMSNQMKN